MRDERIAELISAAAEPLGEIDGPGFGALADRFANARVVLVGDGSHGTSDFYRARCAITRRLIEAHGFSIVALEADWPDAASLDRRVRGRPEPQRGEAPFRRFPTWMWRNAEVEAFVAWLAKRNAELAPRVRAGIYGLDLYNLRGSMRAVIDYLERIDPQAATEAKRRYGCLEPWATAPERYGMAARTTAYGRCEAEVVQMLKSLNERALDYAARGGDDFLDATANARLVADAEAYYRAMYLGVEESWNVRDRHMFDTLCQLIEHRGADAKAVVWAHNSHVGDARHTDMGRARGELNIGQLCRERFGPEAVLIGQGTHTGTVACADDWDEPMKIKPVNRSRPDSYEALCHAAGPERFLLDLRQGSRNQVDAGRRGALDAARDALMTPRLERFIGVIYRPQTERWSHYVECQLPRQFDAWLWFDATRAVEALETAQAPGEEETWPSGL